MNAPERRPSPSKSDAELQSRLTSVADAELQQMLPTPDGGDTTTNAKDHEFSKSSKEILPPIGPLKGEREKLVSRTSSMASRRMKRQSQSRLSDRDEEDEDDESDPEGLAPWLTPSGKKKEKIRQSRASRSRATTRMSHRALSAEGDELKELENIISGKVKLKSRAGEMGALGETSNTDRDSSLDRNTGSVDRKTGSVNRRDGRASKGKHLKKGRATVMKVPRIKLSLRRTSSAKIPKELQERLGQMMEKERRVMSSHGRRSNKDMHAFTDSESDWDKKKNIIRYRMDPTKVIKEKGKDRLKLPKINFGARKRRTSSAKLPKEFQEKLAAEMEKNRKVRSSLSHIPKEDFLGISETEAEVSANDTDKEVSKDLHPTKPDTKTQGVSDETKDIMEGAGTNAKGDVDSKAKTDEKLSDYQGSKEKSEEIEKLEENDVFGETDAAGKHYASKSVMSRSSISGSRGTMRRKQGDDTAFEDDDGLSSVVDSLRGGAVNRLADPNEEPERITDSRKLDEEQVDSALEEDVDINELGDDSRNDIRRMSLREDYQIMNSVIDEDGEGVEHVRDSKGHANVIEADDEVISAFPESQATLDPWSRLSQQSLKSVSLADELEFETSRPVAEKVKPADGKEAAEEKSEKAKVADGGKEGKGEGKLKGEFVLPPLTDEQKAMLRGKGKECYIMWVENIFL